MLPPITVTVFIATSLDGFIARRNGRLDWLPGQNDVPKEAAGSEDYGYGELINSVDALVMGRNTFEKVLTFDEWPYPGLPVVVLSSRPVSIPPAIADEVEVMGGSPEDVVARLALRGWRNLYVDGGVTIQRFLRAGLIQRLIITRVPVLLGEGIPLFGPLPHDLRLRHIETRPYPNGLVQSEYAVIH